MPAAGSRGNRAGRAAAADGEGAEAAEDEDEEMDDPAAAAAAAAVAAAPEGTIEEELAPEAKVSATMSGRLSLVSRVPCLQPQRASLQQCHLSSAKSHC